jgi:hypothetical protein
VNWRRIALAAALLAVAGCQSLGGPQRLVAELQAQGVSAAMGTDLDAGLLGGVPTIVCAGDESVTVYEYRDVDSTIAAAALIDQDDPSMVGNAIVEWAGTPHFWLRDRVIVLYVGEDPEVNAALRNILGRPFAEGRDPGRGVPGGGPPCERAG